MQQVVEKVCTTNVQRQCNFFNVFFCVRLGAFSEDIIQENILATRLRLHEDMRIGLGRCLISLRNVNILHTRLIVHNIVSLCNFLHSCLLITPLAALKLNLLSTSVIKPALGQLFTAKDNISSPIILHADVWRSPYSDRVCTNLYSFKKQMRQSHKNVSYT